MENEVNIKASFKIMGARTNNTSTWLYARKKRSHWTVKR